MKRNRHIRWTRYLLNLLFPKLLLVELTTVEINAAEDTHTAYIRVFNPIVNE